MALINDSSELATRMVKAQLEKTLLGTLCQSMSLVMRPSSAFVDIVLDLPLIEQLQLRIDPLDVRRAIVAQRKLKLAWDQVKCGPAIGLVCQCRCLTQSDDTPHPCGFVGRTAATSGSRLIMMQCGCPITRPVRSQAHAVRLCHFVSG